MLGVTPTLLLAALLFFIGLFGAACEPPVSLKMRAGAHDIRSTSVLRSMISDATSHVMFTASAVSATVSQGIVLLGFYSLGLGLPFIAAAAFTDGLVARLRALRRIGRSLQLGAGAVVVAMGIAILTGELTTFSYWLLETFPALSRIG